jgi:hypothetical protein
MKKHYRPLIGIWALLQFCNVVCAQLPDTDIWLFDLRQKGDSFVFTNPVNFTNRPGYDNQPAFSPDSKRIYYTSYRDGQSDIYTYEIASKTTTAFCKTPESEYSPTVTPDGKFVSVVRVEKDSAQRLWKFPLNGGAPILVLKNIDSIGYFAWTGEHHLVLFRLGAPEKLYRISVNKDDRKYLVRLADKPGRSIRTDVGHEITYIVLKRDSLSFVLTQFDPLYALDEIKSTEDQVTFKEHDIIKMPHQKEDFAIYKDSHFLMGDGPFMYSTSIPAFPLRSLKINDPKSAKDWKLTGDFSSFGLKNMMRMVISPDGKKIAIVSSN